jgi:hypothetical protein
MLNVLIVSLTAFLVCLYFVYTITKDKEKKSKFIFNKVFFCLLIISILSGILLAPYHDYNPNVDGGMYSIFFYFSTGLSLFFLISYLITDNYETK